jgi:hypothetical protein
MIKKSYDSSLITVFTLFSDYYDGSFEIEDKDEIQEPKAPVYGFQRNAEIYETKAEPCDQGATLYLLQHLSKEGYHSALPVNCSR